LSAPNVLFFSRDPGATNQLVAVYELLCRSSDSDVPAIEKLRECLAVSDDTTPNAIIVGKKYALDVWRTAGIQAENGEETTPQHLIEARNISLVITGTDDIDEPDTAQLWQTAQMANIPVAVFLDNLVNLEPRFRTRDGKLITPDLVFALDHHSVETLTAAGIPAGNLHTTVNLHLARLSRIAKDNAGARENLRAQWQAGEASQVVLFASENTTEMASLGRSAPYDEHAILKALIEDIANSQPIGSLTITPGKALVVIRPHPRDAAGKYDTYAQAANPTIRISAAGSPLEAILAADVIVGMDSALLFEAQALDCPALSLVSTSKFNKIFA
jgi:hypothetical protein